MEHAPAPAAAPPAPALSAPPRGLRRRPTVPVSVTAIEFMPRGREHLLLSACDSDAIVRLWDMRTAMAPSGRRSQQLLHRQRPLNHTALPANHAASRSFGVSSLSLSPDGARLYSVCKDNTVYVHATSQLRLGHAPDLEPRSRTTTTLLSTDSDGGGRPRFAALPTSPQPLYGFRSDSFHVNSFYVKSAVRAGLLAVGSSDSCAVLFPTDERYLENLTPTATVDASLGSDEGVPIYHFGTPLVRGHDKEVGSVVWTPDDRLVTISDDRLVRRWRENASRAADLRTGGEAGGRRWGCGWADVGDNYDDDGW